MAAPSASTAGQPAPARFPDWEAGLQELDLRCSSGDDLPACVEGLVGIFAAIRDHCPSSAPLPAGVDLRLVGAKALNFFAEAAKKHFGQGNPLLAKQRWSTPLVRRFDRSSGRSLRVSYMEQATDRLMSATQTGVESLGSKHRPAPNSALIGGDALLGVAPEVLYLCCADLKIVEDYGEYKVTLPAITDIDGDWNELAFSIVGLTLTALGRSLSAWFRHGVTSPKILLFGGQIVPGTNTMKQPQQSSRPDTSFKFIDGEASGRLKGLDSSHRNRLADINGLVTILLRLPTPIPNLGQCGLIVSAILRTTAKAQRELVLTPREYSSEILKLAVFALQCLDSHVVAFFKVPDAALPTKLPTYNIIPKCDRPQMPSHPLAFAALREWALQECLNDMWSLPALHPARFEILFSVLVHSMGHAVPAGPLHHSRPNDIVGYLVEPDPTDEWREQMLELCRMAIVGVAQTLSAAFGDAEIKLWNMVVPRGRGREMQGLALIKSLAAARLLLKGGANEDGGKDDGQKEDGANEDCAS